MLFSSLYGKLQKMFVKKKLHRLHSTNDSNLRDDKNATVTRVNINTIIA